jgi:hypothetical protein
VAASVDVVPAELSVFAAPEDARFPVLLEKQQPVAGPVYWAQLLLAAHP